MCIQVYLRFRGCPCQLRYLLVECEPGRRSEECRVVRTALKWAGRDFCHWHLKVRDAAMKRMREKQRQQRENVEAWLDACEQAGIVGTAEGTDKGLREMVTCKRECGGGEGESVVQDKKDPHSPHDNDHDHDQQQGEVVGVNIQTVHDHGGHHKEEQDHDQQQGEVVEVDTQTGHNHIGQHQEEQDHGHGKQIRKKKSSHLKFRKDSFEWPADGRPLLTASISDLELFVPFSSTTYPSTFVPAWYHLVHHQGVNDLIQTDAARTHMFAYWYSFYCG